MKKIFISPEIEIAAFEIENIVTMSIDGVKLTEDEMKKISINMTEVAKFSEFEAE